MEVMAKLKIGNTKILVVSIGHLTALYVIFVPLESIPSRPPHKEYTPLEQKQHKKQSNNQWRLLYCV